MWEVNDAISGLRGADTENKRHSRTTQVHLSLRRNKTEMRQVSLVRCKMDQLLEEQAVVCKLSMSTSQGHRV